ncbi:MAG: hypothetical protein KF817_00970 [Phycisphaeraceae bacterium]|nr:hypothetical protein [Phycisphaeraceae bacterium]
MRDVHATSSRRPHRAAFTLTEMMVALAVLIGVLVAVGRIFSTTSRVTSLGEGNSQVLQEAAAIEQLLREDFRRLSHEGVFGIRNTAVRNDANGAVLINPALPRDAVIRADEMLFFTQGLQAASVYRIGQGDNRKGQSTMARVYFGHGWQYPQQVIPDAVPVPVTAVDAEGPVDPWTRTGSPLSPDPVQARARFYSGASLYQASGAVQNFVFPANDARRWLLVRDPILLLDDDYNSAGASTKGVYLNQVSSYFTIFLDDPVLGYNPVVTSGRLDAAASEMQAVRERILYRWNGGQPSGLRPWSGVNDSQYAVIADSLFYRPRAERVSLHPHRIHQGQTSAVLSPNCSQVRIDWTWRHGTGALPESGYAGVRTRREGVVGQDRAQPWFGLRDASRAVYPYGDPDLATEDQDWWDPADTIFPGNIESWNTGDTVVTPVRVYEAIFGFNQTVALNANGVPDATLGYTPWPSAIRISITLHDQALAIERGREIEFIIELPGRAPSP